MKAKSIDESIEKLRRQGYEEAERYRKLMSEAAKEMKATSIVEALEKLKEKHVSSVEDLFKTYRETLVKLKKFLVEKEVVELPLMERVEIIETPEFMRPLLLFAAYIPSKVFSWNYTGIFLVTPPANEEMLRHHNIYDIMNNEYSRA